MKLPMLVVDKNIEVSEREQAEWLRHGIHTVRVDTMQEAIEKLGRESFYIIAINADNVNYLPLLKIMSDITTVHIFIVDSHFTTEKQNEAFDNGATGYAQFYDNAEKNVQSALSYLKSIHKRSKTLKQTLKTIKCGNLTIVADHNKVFCNDMEVIFTAQEYEILYYFMTNLNHTLTFKQMSRKIWETETTSNNAMWQVINRLRRKLNEAGCRGGEIINFRGIGYRFSTLSNK